ncbi:PRADC1-like protein [Uloborus diversus]|uniref:PRADC1-like protein n=1 Tax=Uloborus diversus TaxID=327109 RepID=UPI0024098F11|nr:PRADC1-like protein [Uloborus diversus]
MLKDCNTWCRSAKFKYGKINDHCNSFILLILSYIILHGMNCGVLSWNIYLTFEDSEPSKEDLYFEIVEPETLHYTFKVRPAQDFGIPFNESLNNVGLVLAEPPHGCSAPINRLELRNNVALIDRGGCSFLSKCVQAEHSGVLAVVICDSDTSNDDQFIDMIDDNTKRNCSIPAVFLLGKDGYMIKKGLKTHNLNRAIINMPVNFTFVPLHEKRHPPWIL